MSKQKWVAQIIMCGFVISMSGGCEDKDRGTHQEVKFQHRLVKVDCMKEPAEDREIKVEVENTKQVLKNIIDDVILVCENDDVTWFTKDDKILIEIHFKDSYGEELFGTTKFGSKKGELKTPSQKVKHQVNKHDDYKYSIDITDLDGKPLQNIDPHIIPM